MRQSALLLLVLFCTCVRAQETLTPRLRSFNSEDYRADNQNWAVTQSPQGILYVANSAGVLCFDGLNWTTRELPGRPTVRAVTWHDERLFVGGYGEFGYFTASEGRLEGYTSLSAQLPADERTEEIWNIEVFGNGTVILQSFSRFYRFADGELTVLKVGPVLFAHASGDLLYVPLADGGLTVFSDELQATNNYLGTPRKIVDITGEKDRIIYATATGIYLENEGELEAWSAEVNALVAEQQINRILALSDGSLAVGTIMAGVYVFTSSGTLSNHLNYGNGLPNNTVLALFEDRKGNLWVGTDRGLAVTMRSEPLSYYQPGESSIGAVYAAAEYGGGFYVGTNQGLFLRGPSGDYQLVPGTAGQVWELRATTHGLLCGHNNGTFIVVNDRARLISTRSGGWQTIPLPHDSTYFLQANYTGLSLISTGGEEVESAVGKEKVVGRLLAPLRYLVRTAEQRFLALHGSRGAYRIDLSEDWQRIVSVDTISSPDLVRASIADFGDTLLVQSAAGHYHYLDDAFVPLKTFRGVELVAGQYVLPGRSDSNEWFLVAADRLKAYRGTRKLAAYPIKLRRNNPKIVALTDSSYLLGLEEGFAIYRMEAPTEKEPALRLRQTQPQRGVWRFDYGLPVLDRGVRYRYRLRGFDDGWSEWSAAGNKDYTNLGEGDYTFEVQADWYEATASVSFSLPPPWHRTVWAYIGYALLGGGILYLLFREHRNQLRQQARKLEVVRGRQLQRQRIEARNAELEKESDRKSRELANTTLTLAKKNEMLLDLREGLENSGEGNKANDTQKLLHLIERNLNSEEDWAIFESHFNEVHDAFLRRMRSAHPTVTVGDLKLAAYLKMDLSSKEIAPLLHISVRGVENKRYRLRKKLGLSGNDNLNWYVRDF